MARLRHNTTIVLSGVTALLGVAIVVTTIARGGGPAAVGIVVGGALAVLGSARVYLAVAGMRERDGT